MVAVEAFVVSVGEYRSKEAKCFFVCWDIYGGLLEIILKLDDVYQSWVFPDFVHADVFWLGGKVGHLHFGIVGGWHGDGCLLNFEAFVQ